MRATNSGGWLPGLDRNPPAEVDLFCLPYAGGGASSFRGWGAALLPEIRLLPVQLPGRESRMREPLETRLTSLVAALVGAVRDQLRPPYVVFGHSMGALLGFELARTLRAKGHPMPAALVVSGYRAPHLPDVDEPIHELDDSELLAHLETMAGTPAAVLQDEALCELILPIVRADFEICETYTFEALPPLDLPIIVYRGEHDFRLPAGSADAWQEHTTATCTVRSFPGDHFFVHSARREVLASLRADCLFSTRAGAGWSR